MAVGVTGNLIGTCITNVFEQNTYVSWPKDTNVQNGTTLALPSVTSLRAQGQLCVLLHNSVHFIRIFVSSVQPWGYLKAEGKIPVNTMNVDYKFDPFVANYASVEILLWKKHRKQFLFYTPTPSFVKNGSVIRRSNVRTDGRKRPLLFA